MRILQINKFNYIEGGAERYYLELSKLLRLKGHQVAFFSMEDYRNIKTKWSKYFVSNITFRKVNILNGLNIVKRMIYSFESAELINKLLDEFKPDIVHIHNIYNHISPSILPEIKKRKIPIIQTVHDYHLISPHRNLYHDGQICEITKKKQYFNAIFHKCVKKSYLASFLSTFTLYLHDWFRLYIDNIDYYITPSKFIKDKLIEYDFSKKNILILQNFILNHENIIINQLHRKSYVLYVGRLSPEKGISFLLDVIKRLPNISFKIVGTGPLEEDLKFHISKYQLKNVQTLGYQSETMRKLMIQKSYFSIVPSMWYEGLGMVILESNIYGKPVVASKIGGIPEVIKDKVNGLLFKPGDIDDCVEKILTLWNNPKLVKRMGRMAYQYVKSNFNPEKHYKELMKIYRLAIEKKKQ